MSRTEKIIEIIREEIDSFGDKDVEIIEDMNLASDLNIDSLDMFLVIDHIENEFKVKFTSEDLYDIRTILDIEKKITEIEQK